jgi:hypothetical protein
MRVTLVVQDFLNRTKAAWKHLSFTINDPCDKSDIVVNLSVREVASTLTRNGGKLYDCNTLEELANRYAKMQNWNLIGFSVSDGV